MKKLCLLSLILLLFTAGCMPKDVYMGWNTVVLPKIGSFKIPKNMQADWDNDMLIVSNKDNKELVYFIGTIYTDDYYDRLSQYIDKDIVYDGLVWAKVFPNGTVTNTKFLVDGVAYEYKHIMFLSEDNVHFEVLSMDEHLEEDILVKIANSFESE